MNIFRCFLLGLAVFTASRLAAQAPDETSGVIKSVPAPFPAALQARGITAGRAKVALSIGPTGQVIDCLIQADTEPEFGEAALAAVRQWTFNPAALALDESQLMTIEFIFGDRTASDGIPWVYQVPILNQLDHIPAPLKVVRPNATKVLKPNGNITIVFYIDELGQVRLPAVAIGINPEVDQLTLDAVRQWHFEPPQMQGHPTAVRSQQTFRFTPNGLVRPDILLKPPVKIAEYVLPGPLYGASAVTDGNALYIVSGKGSPTAPILSRILRFDLATHTFTTLAQNKLMPRLFGGAALVDGKIYLLGGNGLVKNTWKHTQIYDIATDTIKDGPTMPHARAHFATGVIGRRIYVAGGGIEGLEPERSMDYFDLDTGHWAPGTPMKIGGYASGVVPPNGRFVLAGGINWGWGTGARFRRWGIYQTVVRAYLPKENRWIMRPRLAWPIEASTVQTVNWRLYIFGNYDEVEVYDLASGVSQPFKLPPGGGYGATSAVVGDKIYLIGGTLDPRRGLTSRMLQVYQVQP